MDSKEELKILNKVIRRGRKKYKYTKSRHDRLNHKVEKVEFSECWECNCYYGKGYYPFYLYGSTKGSILRILYDWLVDEIKDDSYLRNKCGNKRCVNPDHYVKKEYQKCGKHEKKRKIKSKPIKDLTIEFD